MPSFLNMLSWWQWTILAAIPPAIVLLYFLKLKRRPVEVPSTFLWKKSTEDLHVNAIWQRLRRNLLLFLQLAVIALAAGVFMRPHWQGAALTGSRFVFLVDNSASMSATDAKPNRLEEAKRQAAELIDQMASGDAAMLISFADSARVEQSFTDNRQQLKKALAAIRPTPRGTSLVEALKLAAGLVAGRPSDEARPAALSATMYIFSDGRFPPVDTKLKLENLTPKFITIGSPTAKNVGVTVFSTSRNETRPERIQAYARLDNFGSEAATVDTKLYLDGELKDAAQGVVVPPNDSQGLTFDLGEVSSGVLRLEAKTGDNLAIDDTAYAVINPPARCRILVVTPGCRELLKVLKTKKFADLADVRVESPAFLDDKTKPSYSDLAAAGAWQLIIFDRCRPKKSPACHAFYINELPPEGGWSFAQPAAAPHDIDFDIAHPLLQWLEMGNVLIQEARPLKVPQGGRMLFDSEAGPLMAIAGRDAFEDVVLGFSLDYPNTNWTYKSFCLFMLNWTAYFEGNRSSSGVGMLRPGMTATLDSHVPLQIRTPSGKTIEAAPASGKVVFAETGDLGL